EETDEESGADTEGTPEEIAAEAKKEETKEEIKAETETKEKEVTKDTKEKENAKAKEETKKEDKKEEVAKSSDSSDIKKIDEVISQVMDKKNPDYLLKFNSEELALIRNTLYARRGLKYTKGKYKTYFEGKSWYKPSVTSGKDLLPEKEERLVEIIRKYEKKAKK
ncbi:MAG: YARHG domain-containing protein, partial [Fusobacterium periodonticum]|nr:YARHG domain-containing protein [Fusobacterium periodonticum]